MRLKEQEVYYLNSILRNLREVHAHVGTVSTLAPTLGSEVLADNIDWLDCFIDANTREKVKKPIPGVGTTGLDAGPYLPGQAPRKRKEGKR